MAETDTTPDAPDDPYAHAPPQAPQAAPPAQATHPGQASPPRSPWTAAQPPVAARDPAVRLEAPPDPYAGKWGPAPRGSSVGDSGANEMVLAGIGRLLEQNERILELLKGGARF